MFFCQYRSHFFKQEWGAKDGTLDSTGTLKVVKQIIPSGHITDCRILILNSQKLCVRNHFTVVWTCVQNRWGVLWNDEVVNLGKIMFRWANISLYIQNTHSVYLSQRFWCHLDLYCGYQTEISKCSFKPLWFLHPLFQLVWFISLLLFLSLSIFASTVYTQIWTYLQKFKVTPFVISRNHVIFPALISLRVDKM